MADDEANEGTETIIETGAASAGEAQEVDLSGVRSRAEEPGMLPPGGARRAAGEATDGAALGRLRPRRRDRGARRARGGRPGRRADGDRYVRVVRIAEDALSVDGGATPG